MVKLLFIETPKPWLGLKHMLLWLCLSNPPIILRIVHMSGQCLFKLAGSERQHNNNNFI